MHEKILGCTVLGEVHPVGSQNKTLISDTDDNDFIAFLSVLNTGLHTSPNHVEVLRPRKYSTSSELNRETL